ncbi:TRAUB-domain-containing protein [Lepidopterella palustris CBS 459.81]|uniref:Protein BFR2 n=1 Tax=Lepidopterella palustris CBS 459.81 TaxID=1314670 RepID=A0A8E2JAE4_9PEZI|nr:TRAUB-domain-containing protein [Lepidopterella palustris CBS 459.81]
MKKHKTRDFDPEELLDPAPSDSEGSSNEETSEDEQVGREHYVDLGKSKLRKREAIPLGPQYIGSRVSRDAALDEDSDDPFTKGFDVDSSEEESDEVPLKNNGVKTHDSEDSGEEEIEKSPFSDEDSEDEVQPDEASGDNDEDEDEDGEQDDESMSDAEHKDDITNRAAIRKIMSEEQKSVAATISQAAKADAEKGSAVKSQRKIFDSLLNTRIQLQKALISANSLPPTDSSNTGENAIQAAETAALNLLTTLSSLRSTLDATRTGTKRKRSPPLTTSTPSSAIWSSIKTFESQNLSHRRAILEKWSVKSRPTPILPHARRLNNSASAQQTITDVLNTHLSDTPRLVKRTRTPRSCAPVQSAAGVVESADIYDDADFYGLLLKELLEQRSQDVSTSGINGAAFIQTPWQAAREAKTRRVVDTRASKGRKLRYTVHEKLQNFMAPEDRRSWGERQIDELFGSLFGRKMGLSEEVEKGYEDMEDEVDDPEQGLLLFRS